MSRDDFRGQADAVRSIPLPAVLIRFGAQRDRRDRSQWRTHRGPLSITGEKFFNWHCHQGGGGAIDLVMHLSDCDARSAVRWLQQQLGTGLAPRTHLSASVRAAGSGSRGPAQGQFHLPWADPAKLPRVLRYLNEQRRLMTDILLPLIAQRRLYADRLGNAVFPMVAGKPHQAIGAELRGTGCRRWRGLAPGTCKDAGYFWIGRLSPQRIVLCESAIDAISCFQWHDRTQLSTPDTTHSVICISTAGVRPDPPWLALLLERGYPIYCGFDDDQPGNTAAGEMIRRHPAIKRLQPPAHDWNDALRND